MKKFYIFLDIDGVMYDYDYIIAEIESGRMERGGFIRKFKPESVQALNLLIEELEKYYDVRLVISSTWRANMPFIAKILKNNGLEYNKEMERTPIYDPSKRGEQILDYLQDKENFDFVIIDDEMFDFKKFFKQDKIIKCEMFHSSLNIGMVNDFLRKTIENKEERILK